MVGVIADDIGVTSRQINQLDRACSPRSRWGNHYPRSWENTYAKELAACTMTSCEVPP